MKKEKITPLLLGIPIVGIIFVILYRIKPVLIPKGLKDLLEGGSINQGLASLIGVYQAFCVMIPIFLWLIYTENIGS